jgi:hypothetical protein
MKPALTGERTFTAKFPELALYLIYATIMLLARHNPFFWDSILQASQYGQWFYITNFKHFFYPDAIDAGYSPLFGLLLALSWKILGYKLWVSHLVILPFALGIVRQVINLSRRFLPGNYAVLTALLVLADPTLVAQISQVSPDVLLVFFYLFCLNKLLSNQRLAVSFALIFLGMISLRGTIAVAALFFTDICLTVFFARQFQVKKLLKTGATYIPAFVCVTTWAILHFQHTGWIGYNPDPTWSWSEGRQLVPFQGMLRNGAIIIWRMLDFGRIFIWVGLTVTGFYFLRKRLKFPPAASRLFIAAFVPFLLFSIISLPYSNPIGHRYYMVVFLLVTLLACYLLFQIPHKVFRNFTFSFMFLGLITGHFWVYPDSIAKGWDGTLAHLPYFELRSEAISYLEQQHIPRSEVGSDFPNLAPLSQTDLLPDSVQFRSKDLQTDNYVLYSNIFNGFTDEELLELKTTWQPVKTWKKGLVKVILYQRKP